MTLIDELLEISGYSQSLLDEENADVRIINCDDLEFYRTICGYEDNLHFTNNVIAFLKKIGVKEIAIVYCDGDNYRFVMELLMEISDENAKKLVKMVSVNGGALILNRAKDNKILLSSYE